MTPRLTGPLAATLAIATLAGCSASDAGESSASPATSASAIEEGQYTAGEATGTVDSVTWWGDYRALYTLDPIALADYPEQTIIPNICEPMLKVNADYSIETGAVAYEMTDDTHVVLTLQDGVTFSDGSEVTIEDVAFSIGRNLDPDAASNYAYLFTNVASIDITGDKEVTLTLSQKDTTLEEALATLAGAIVKESFVEEAGVDFGSPTVGVMCTGPFEVESYDGSSELVLTRNENYWDTDNAALAETFTFVFPADTTAVANALESGEIDGALDLPSSLLSTLSESTTGTVYVGGEGSTPINVDILVSATEGAFADTTVRQALSMALDREAIADKIFSGAADPLYRVSGPGLWGYAEETFAASYEALVADPDVDAAAAMIEEAGMTGATVVMAYPAGDSQSEQLATVIQQTGQSIGLDFQIEALPLQQYGSLFGDASAREGYDALITKNYVELPDPASMDRLYGGTGGGTNFSDYSNATVDDNLAAARATDDEEEKASYVLAAEEQLDQDLPSIPMLGMRAAVYLSDDLAGAPLNFSYVSSAWAAKIGAK